MSTVRDIVNAAFRHLGVVASGENVASENASDGLKALIALVSGWQLKLGTSTDPASWDLNTTFPLDAKFEDATALLLAKRLSSQYPGMQGLDPLELSDAERNIQAASLTITEASVDTGLTKMPSQYWGNGQRVRW